MTRNERYKNTTAAERGKGKGDVVKRKRGGKRRLLCDIDSDSGSEEISKDSDSDSKMGLGSLLNTTSAEEKSGSEDEKQLTRKHSHKDRDEVAGKDKYEQTSYRSNMQSAIKDLKGLTFQRAHLKAIKRTPFWLLFSAIYNSDESKLKKRCDKDEKSISQIILSYDDLNDTFQIGGRIVRLTKRDVQLVFGVISGTKPLSTKSSNCEDPGWIVRCFKKETEKAKGKLIMYKSHLLNKMKELLGIREGRELDVARLAHCYLLAAVLAPNKNASMPSNVTRCLEDFGGICDYDWCTYITDMLKTQIGGRKSSRAGGCTILLPYWLCEHVKLVKPINTVAFPRFLRWNLNDVNKKLARTDIGDLDPDDVFEDELEATKVEKETIRSLVDYWKIKNKGTQKDSYLGTPTRRRKTPGTAIKIASVRDDDFVTTVQIGLQITPARGGAKRMRGNKFYSDDPSCSKNQGSNAENYNNLHQSNVRVNASTNQEYSVNENSGFELSIPRLSDPNDVHFWVNDQAGVEFSKAPLHQGGPGEGLDAAVQFAVGYCNSEDEEKKSLKFEVGILKEKVREKERLIFEQEKIICDMGGEMDMLKDQLAIARGKDRELENLRAEIESCRADAKSNLSEKMRTYLDTKWGGDKAALISNHEMQLSKKDEEIANLRAQIVEINNPQPSYGKSEPNIHPEKDMEKNEEENGYLRAEVEDLTTPVTLTQILESPECLAHVDEVERQLYSNTEKEKPGGEMTPKGGEKGNEPAGHLNSMIKRVKERTAKDDRKAIEFTPPPSTAEIIVLDDKRKNNGRTVRAAGKGKLRWDKNCDAVKKTNPQIKERIQAFWEEEGGSAVVWEGKGSLNRVLLCDLLQVLHHERLSGPIIDSWAELLINLAKGRENAARTVVLNGNCWDLIANENDRSKGLLDLYVNGPLDSVGTNYVVILPILAESLPGVPGRLGDHWTLLKLDLKDGGWTFLNPMCPRSSDPHLSASYIVIEYVESRLRERFRSLEPRHLLVKGQLGRPTPMPSVQQLPGSLDCGIVVCYHIENEIFRRRSGSGVMSKGLCGDYRKRMAEWFVQPTDIVVDNGTVSGSSGGSRLSSN